MTDEQKMNVDWKGKNIECRLYATIQYKQHTLQRSTKMESKEKEYYKFGGWNSTTKIELLDVNTVSCKSILDALKSVK